MEQSILRVSNLRSSLDRRTREPFFILEEGSQKICIRELARSLYVREDILINKIKTYSDLQRLIRNGKL